MSGLFDLGAAGTGVVVYNFTNTTGGAANSQAIAIPGIDPLNIGFGCVTDGVSYTMEHSFDGTNWFPHPFVASAVTNMDGNYAFPVRFIRIALAANGTVSFTGLIPGARSSTTSETV